MEIDIAAEAKRLRDRWTRSTDINIFVSEGAGVEAIVAELQAKGQEVPRDAFGHIKLDAVNPGKWFGEQFAQMIGSEKTLIQKSGYFARASAANSRGYPPHQILRRPGRRMRLAPRSRRHRPRRRSRRRTARHRVPAHQGRQALRYRYPLVRRHAGGHRTAERQKAHGQSLEKKPKYAGMKPCKPTVDSGFPARIVRPHPLKAVGAR
jgi:hypothetical protein